MYPDSELDAFGRPVLPDSFWRSVRPVSSWWSVRPESFRLRASERLTFFYGLPRRGHQSCWLPTVDRPGWHPRERKRPIVSGA